MVTDPAEFGPIVDRLVGQSCARSLVTNSIKLRFDTRIDPRGRKYIWIDPPWRLFGPGGLHTSSADYDEADFKAWSDLLAPLDTAVLASWRVADDRSVVFAFAHGYHILLPWDGGKRDKDTWYAHWYARDHDHERLH